MTCAEMSPLWIGLGFGGMLFLIFAGAGLLVRANRSGAAYTPPEYPAIWKMDTVPVNEKEAPDA